MVSQFFDIPYRILGELKGIIILVKVMIGARAFSKMELLALTDKLKRFTTTEDKPKLNELICKELYHYSVVSRNGFGTFVFLP